MRKFLIAAGLCVAAGAALAQIGPMFPGPGQGAFSPPCTQNTQGGGTYADIVRLYHLNNSVADSGPSGVAGVLKGTAAFSNVQSKFGGYTLLNATAAGTANGMTIGNFTIAASTSFTIETWVYFTNNYVYQVFLGDNVSSQITSTGYFSATASTGEYYDYGNGNTVRTTAGFMSLNAWHHIAFVRNGTTVAIYLDGVVSPLAGSGASTGIVGGASAQFSLGCATGSCAAYGIVGYLSEFRISKMARYTANFTPQTFAFCNN